MIELDITIIAPSEIPARRANTLQVMKMAQAISILGHRIHLLVPFTAAASNASAATFPGWDELAWHYGLSHPFEILWLPANKKLRRYDFSLNAVRAARKLQSDLIYTRLPQAAAISSRLGIATIFELHDIPHGRFGPWLFRQFLAGSGRRRLVTITAALQAELLQRFEIDPTPSFAVVAPDGVDLERYIDLPTPGEARIFLHTKCDGGEWNSFDPQKFTVGYTGHLYPGRGSELLLELAERLPQVNFLIVGGEPAHVEALQRAGQLRELTNLILTGFVPNAELPLFQAACEILLMPYQQKVEASSGGDISRYLSPMKLFEYLASERAIISSDLAVLKEVLTPDNCLLIRGDQPEAWEVGIKKLIEDPRLRKQLAAQARTDANRYTWESRSAKILDGLDT